MKNRKGFWIGAIGVFVSLAASVLLSCSQKSSNDDSSSFSQVLPPGLSGLSGCENVKNGFGPDGTIPLKVEKLVTGLEVPWGIAFLPTGEMLVTERPGRVRLVRGNSLAPQPVLEVKLGETTEGGLLGIAVDPAFASNRFYYVYYTAAGGGNRLERYRLNEDMTGSTLQTVMLDNIPAGAVHDGGRLKFGPDGALYLSTGEGHEPERAQDQSTFAGKLLRIPLDGGAPEIYLSGIRNSQGFDWFDDSTLVVSDHGPTGELGLSGRDEVNIARKGDNLGWPRITSCETGAGYITPIMTWTTALPPGGTVIYRGALVPSFQNSILITSLGATHLHRIAPDKSHEVYLSGDKGFGRLRDIVIAPDGAIMITTSNCDGRGTCGADKDMILRVTEGS